MPELKDIAFRPQVVSARVNLPHKPQLPPEILDRFPQMRDYQDQEQSWWQRTRKLLYQSYEEQSFTLDNSNYNYLALSEKVDDNAASIVSLAKVVADEDAAISLRIDGLSSSIGDGARTKVFAQPEPPDPDDFDLIDGDLWFDSNDSNKVYRWRAAGMEWVLLADSRIAGAVAAISEFATTYASIDFAEAKKSEAIIAAGTYTDASTLAAVTSLTTAYTSADSTLASRATALESSVNTPTTGLLARVAIVESTYATTTFAEAKKSEAISAASSDATAKVLTESNARTSADGALADQIALISATNARTKVYSQPTAPSGALLVAEDLWFDSDDDYKVYRWSGSTWSLIADGRIASQAALISTIQSTYATQSAVVASIDTALIAASNDATAKVLTESNARVASDGNLSGKYTLKVTAGDVVTGMNITSTSGPGGDVSQIMFQADIFKIYNGTTGLAMFDVSASKVRLGGVLTVDLAGQKLFTGTGTFGNANTPFFVDSNGSFSLKDKLTWDATTSALAINGSGTFTGTVTATGGTFGGWTLSSTTLSSNGVVLDSAGQLLLGTSNDICVLTATDAVHRLWIGHATSGSAAFKVSKAGVLTATGVNISGTITATAGSIGGTLITDGTILTAKIGALQITGAKIAAGTITTDHLNFAVVGSTNVVASINASSEGIQISAARVAISGVTIFGSAYDSGTSTISGGAIKTGYIKSGNWASSVGTEIDLDAGTMRLGGSSAPRFSVDTNGRLTATEVTISGAITATSGTFTGTVSASTITGGSISATTSLTAVNITGTSSLALGSGASAVSMNTTDGLKMGTTGGGVHLYGASTAGTLDIGLGGTYPVRIAGGPGASISIGAAGVTLVLNPTTITFPTGQTLVNSGSGAGALLTSSHAFTASALTASGTVTGGRLTTANFDANPAGQFVDVIDNNFRIFNGGTQTFRVDCTTGHLYVTGNRVVGSRGSRGSATLSDVVALLDSWNSWG